jgi:hypothetical protein
LLPCCAESLLFRKLIKANGLARDPLIGGKPQKKKP